MSKSYKGPQLLDFLTFSGQTILGSYRSSWPGSRTKTIALPVVPVVVGLSIKWSLVLSLNFILAAEAAAADRLSSSWSHW